MAADILEDMQDGYPGLEDLTSLAATRRAAVEEGEKSVATTISFGNSFGCVSLAMPQTLQLAAIGSVTAITLP